MEEYEHPKSSNIRVVEGGIDHQDSTHSINSSGGGGSSTSKVTSRDRLKLRLESSKQARDGKVLVHFDGFADKVSCLFVFFKKTIYLSASN